MTRRERLMATLRGQAVDHPAVSFYEIGGFTIDPFDPSPFNVYQDPSWQPLLELAENETDLIRLAAPLAQSVAADWNPELPASWAEFFTTEPFDQGDTRYVRTTLRVGGRTMTSLTRRDREINTVWTIEHLLKSPEDAEAYLQLPDEVPAGPLDVSHLVRAEAELGDRGVVMVDTGDPLCWIAPLFAMEDYTVMAFSQPALFHRLLEKVAPFRHAVTEQVARAFPGRLWRIYGPEYATAPYLPRPCFEEYVERYTGPMVKAIKQHGGFARIHCHGRIRQVLPVLQRMGADAIDPIEPPPQGDVELGTVRREYGEDFVLFGNLEVADIEGLPPGAFERVVRRSLAEGTHGEGRGFVLMPSSAPYGRAIAPNTQANYETMVRLARDWGSH
jgi:uroporphyrinogen-III decarboxylase